MYAVNYHRAKPSPRRSSSAKGDAKFLSGGRH